MKETDLAATVVTWLGDQHWDVYQEVERDGAIADIVAAMGPLRWVVECKKTLSLCLLEQAFRWIHRAHFVSIAVPQVFAAPKGRGAARIFCNQNGIGMIAVGPHGIKVYRPPAMSRAAAVSGWRLCEQHKTFSPAGTASGVRWTPFASTCCQLRNLLVDRPGLALSEAMKGIDHHYASDATARATVSYYLRKRPGVIKGIVCRREGRNLNLYLEG
ncbi:MAG: hypothetical protein ABIL58_23510 [Pseudomonadota bacterium]